MCKQVFYLISCVLVLASQIQAETFVWDNGGEGSLWSVPENWEPNGLPTSSDEARIEDPNVSCLIDSSVAAECSALFVNDANSSLEMTGGTLTMDGYLAISDNADSNSTMVISGGVVNVGTTNMTDGRLRVAYRGTGTLIMTGGEMNVYDKIEIGRQSGAVGTVHMYDGTINFAGNSTDLELGTNGTGIFYQYGGVVNIEDHIKLTQSNPESVARLYLYGGVMNAGNLRNPEQSLGDPLIDITEGMLVLPGDYRERINLYIQRGWLVAYEENGILDVTYAADPNQTAVTASMLPPELASHPVPRNRATVELPVPLAWQPGINAVAHHVYFGTDFNDVNEATTENPLDVLVSIGQEETTYVPAVVDFNQTYYWRIDEVNDLDPNSPWKGQIWTFTTQPYITVDDFESYTDEWNHIVFQTWIDGYGWNDPNGSSGEGNGTGAAVGYWPPPTIEGDIKYDGGQSMPLGYGYDGKSLSETTRTWKNPIQLNEHGTTTLSLQFYGSPGNVPGQLFVKINGQKVSDYPGSQDEMGKTEWHLWTIDLSVAGITSIETLTIGITGGAGNVYFDAMRLYPGND